MQECVDYCESDSVCTAAQYKTAAESQSESESGRTGGAPARSCWRRSDVVLAGCGSQATQDVYLRPSRVPGPAPGGKGGALLYAAALINGPAPPLSGY